MLVLSRSVGEVICLPDLGITIKVVQLRGKAATIGIDAPRTICIQRGEIASSGGRTATNCRPVLAANGSDA